MGRKNIATDFLFVFIDLSAESCSYGTKHRGTDRSNVDRLAYGEYSDSDFACNLLCLPQQPQ